MNLFDGIFFSELSYFTFYDIFTSVLMDTMLGMSFALILIIYGHHRMVLIIYNKPYSS